jgi:hypothetical protein
MAASGLKCSLNGSSQLNYFLHRFPYRTHQLSSLLLLDKARAENTVATSCIFILCRGYAFTEPLPSNECCFRVVR